MIATVEQDRALASRLPLLESPHHARADIEVTPAADILDGDVKRLCDAGEQGFEVGFLDRDLDIDVEITPKAERLVMAMRVVDVVKKSVGAGLDVRLVEILDPIDRALAVLGADI